MVHDAETRLRVPLLDPRYGGATKKATIKLIEAKWGKKRELISFHDDQITVLRRKSDTQIEVRITPDAKPGWHDVTIDRGVTLQRGFYIARADIELKDSGKLSQEVECETRSRIRHRLFNHEDDLGSIAIPGGASDLDGHAATSVGLYKGTIEMPVVHPPGAKYEWERRWSRRHWTVNWFIDGNGEACASVKKESGDLNDASDNISPYTDLTPSDQSNSVYEGDNPRVDLSSCNSLRTGDAFIFKASFRMDLVMCFGGKNGNRFTIGSLQTHATVTVRRKANTGDDRYKEDWEKVGTNEFKEGPQELAVTEQEAQTAIGTGYRVVPFEPKERKKNEPADVNKPRLVIPKLKMP